MKKKFLFNFIFQESEYSDRQIGDEAISKRAEGASQSGTKYPERKLVGILLIVFVAVLTIYIFCQPIKDYIWTKQQPRLPKPVKYVKANNSNEDTTLNQATDFLVQPDALNDSGEVETNNNVDQDQKINIPPEMNLDVPFASQAPNAIWDQFHEEMCEEASLIMVNRFYQNRSFTNKNDIEKALNVVKEWEEKNLGRWESTTSEEVAQIAREMLGFALSKTVEIDDFQEIKRQIAQNRPIILPTAGRLLKNPNFRQPGPLYHMLVVRGWLNDGRIITNDPGTRLGEGYLYSAEVLWNAIGDWDGEKVRSDKKVMIVIR